MPLILMAKFEFSLFCIKLKLYNFTQFCTLHFLLYLHFIFTKLELPLYQPFNAIISAYAPIAEDDGSIFGLLVTDWPQLRQFSVCF